MNDVINDVIDVARGITPADLLLKNPLVVNVFTGEILKTSVAIKDGIIAGIGDYTQGNKVVDLSGKYLIPGLIDAHLHIESSMLTPPSFAAAVVPHGTTTVIADPHEIVNVCGLEGLRFMVEASSGLPLDIFYTIPSCVPATHMETAGAELKTEMITEAIGLFPNTPGLAEMMNYPGVLQKTPEVLRKIKAARNMRRLIDGHSPLLTGKDLNAYVSAGISSDHECSTQEEALEKLRLGMTVFIREGSAAKNLTALLPLATGQAYHNLCFCCDDRHPSDLIKEGEMDHILRLAVSAGLSPVRAVQMATINPARHYNLRGLGGIAPGYRADLVVVNDLTSFEVSEVYKNGSLVAAGGELLKKPEYIKAPEMMNTVHLPDLRGKLAFHKPPGARTTRVIRVFPEQILTRGVFLPVSELDKAGDLIMVAVVERHGRNGNIGLGLVQGFGLKNGALASTITHDSHNLLLAGTTSQDMEFAARTVASMGGGLAVVSAGKVLASLSLPVAGLMSNDDAARVAEQYEKLLKAARDLGCTLPSPFMTLSFLALPVIPELRITDRGLVDVNKFDIVDLWL